MGMVFKSKALNILFSHAFVRARGEPKKAFDCCAHLSRIGKLNLLVDSGAFTAFRSGQPIEVGEYIEWCKSIYHESAWQYVALDVVRDPRATAVNLTAMVAAGLKPMPVQTIGAPMEQVSEMVAINDHICVAGGIDNPVNWMQGRYNKVFEASGNKARIHGLGFVKWPAMWQCHLNSVDSSSWMAGQRWGHVFLFSPNKGLTRGMSLKDIILGKKLSLEEATRLRIRGLHPQHISKLHWSGQTNYSAAETTTAFVSMMRHSWYHQKNGRASLFLAINKPVDLAMVAASAIMLNKYGDHWTFDEWEKKTQVFNKAISEDGASAARLIASELA